MPESVPTAITRDHEQRISELEIAVAALSKVVFGKDVGGHNASPLDARAHAGDGDTTAGEVGGRPRR